MVPRFLRRGVVHKTVHLWAALSLLSRLVLPMVQLPRTPERYPTLTPDRVNL
jgi:hypothetical protein